MPRLTGDAIIRPNMKTFFIALVLGIFIGSIITAYFTNPEAFDDLITKASEKTGVDAEKIDEFKEKTGEIIGKGAEKSKELAKETAEASIGIAIIAQLKLNEQVDAKAISVSVDNRIATIEGTVPSKEVYEIVVMTAANTKGVTKVDSRQLKIVPPTD